MLTKVDLARKKALTAQLWMWLKRREKYWFQMSRVKSLMEKDKNTKYFHLMASIRRSKNIIGSLIIGDRCVKSPRSIKKEIVRFFKNLYSKDQSVCLKHTGLEFSCLSQEQKEELDLMPSREEIKRAV